MNAVVDAFAAKPGVARAIFGIMKLAKPKSMK
jgi:hypothetical protein